MASLTERLEFRKTISLPAGAVSVVPISYDRSRGLLRARRRSLSGGYAAPPGPTSVGRPLPPPVGQTCELPRAAGFDPIFGSGSSARSCASFSRHRRNSRVPLPRSGHCVVSLLGWWACCHPGGGLQRLGISAGRLLRFPPLAPRTLERHLAISYCLLTCGRRNCQAARKYEKGAARSEPTCGHYPSLDRRLRASWGCRSICPSRNKFVRNRAGRFWSTSGPTPAEFGPKLQLSLVKLSPYRPKTVKLGRNWSKHYQRRSNLGKFRPTSAKL